MTRLTSPVSPLNAVATAIVMLAALVAPPGVYSAVTYTALVSDMETHAQIDGRAIATDIINKAPRLWRFQEVRLNEMMTHRISAEHLAQELLRVVDDKQNVVAAVGNPPPWPTVTRLQPLFDAGRVVGRLEIHRSLRPLLVNAAWLCLAGLLLAVGSFVSLRVIPLRAVLKANEELRRRDESLAFANALLTATTEDTLDAILIVDEHARIVSYNQHFIDLWQIPRATVEARLDEPVLASVVGQMRDPAAFLARVKYLYDHPEEAGSDRLELKDGRLVDRYSQTLFGPKKQYLGRAWFFRDVTERERAAEAIRQSEAQFKAIFDSARDGIALTDAETKAFLTGNACLCQMLGYTPAEFSGLGMKDIHPPDQLAAIVKEFERHDRGETHTATDIPLQRKDGSVFFADVNSAPVTIDGRKYVLGIFRDTTERKRAEEETRDRLRRSQAQLEAVGRVGLAEALLSGEVETLAREITESAVRVSGCERANVWLFNEAETELHCIDLYEATPAKHSSGMVLREQDFQHEVHVIKTSKYVDADDPLTDPRTKGYSEAYLKPLRITSMLDAAIQAGDRTFGLLCFEHVDKPHHWERDEIAFAGQLADKIGLSIISRMRRQAEAELRKRDALLHAVTASSTELVTAPSLDDAVQQALATVSRTIQVDRMLVFERPPRHGAPPILRYVWNGPDTTVALDAAFFANPALATPRIAAWQAPLSEGKIVVTQTSAARGDVKKMLEGLGIKSLLMLPITVDGRYWGQVGFDTCKQERTWADFEIEILKTLADLIGNAIQRDRYVREIADANRIVQNTPTILYRMRGEPALPMIYISQNIRLFGYEPAALIASPQLYKNLIHPDDLTTFQDSMAQALEQDGQRGVVEFRLLSSRGEYRWFENRFTPIRNAAGRLVEIEGLLIDITERKAAEERIAQLARTDPLTGLPNRATFIERLRQSFAGARRGAPTFAVLYLDIDRFKDINDTLGHPTGDRLLIMVGERLKNSVRETDLVSRFGGDEFSILQSDLEDTADAGALASKLRSALAVPIHVEGNELRITASIGISVWSSETTAPEDLLAQADVALYRAKEEGRDQYRFHTEELDIQVREEVTVADELRGALAREELKLFYQPQVELHSGRIVGMEALVRWQHPTRGLLTPSAFIPIAERTGAIVVIGQWVLDRACQQMHRWQESGIAPQTIAVNISSAQIKAGSEFIKFVTDTLAKWQLSPANLELDVTESMLARAALAQNDVLERLHSLGVKISIDDFGTKYSSLDYLRTYRVNRLKIPQILVNTATRDSESAAVVRAIVGIARELGIEVIAQGVETEAQWSFLTQTSPAAKVQGYYYSEPVAADRAGDLLKRGEIVPAADEPTAAAKLAKTP
jgi:diguanylate cyclase (GGDEF)-like protein/PAS domain S-box-containing protein